jgi:hypothetical protein
LLSFASTALRSAFLAEIGEAETEETRTRKRERLRKQKTAALRVVVNCIASFGVRRQRRPCLR